MHTQQLEEIQNSNLTDLLHAEQKIKIEMDVQAFLSNGGNIEVLEPQMSPAEERMERIQNEQSENGPYEG